MLMLLSVHVTSVLFLVQFNNFAMTMGFYPELHARPFLCALVSTCQDNSNSIFDQIMSSL